MRLLFSEAPANYARYLFPYVIWASPEPGETPADCLERGFALASPQLNRFVLCRHLRINLRHYRPSSENRRVLRKGQGIRTELLPRADYTYGPEQRAAWKRFADQRFGDDVITPERIERLMGAPVITNVLTCHDPASDQEIGTALLFLQEPRAAYYYYAFYDLNQLSRNLGMFMMTQAAGLFAERGTQYLYLGSCYSERALYKTQFKGVEFFNGNVWSDNVEELKYLVRHTGSATTTHLLEESAYLERFHENNLPALMTRSGISIPPVTTDHH